MTIREKPAFFIVGPRKCATSSLDAVLRGVPGVSLPRTTKETFFFHRSRDPAAYLARHHHSNAEAVAEMCPSIVTDGDAVHNLQAAFPCARIGYVLRRPSEIYVSAYRHFNGRGRAGARELALAECDVEAHLARLTNAGFEPVLLRFDRFVGGDLSEVEAFLSAGGVTTDLRGRSLPRLNEGRIYAGGPLRGAALKVSDILVKAGFFRARKVLVTVYGWIFPARPATAMQAPLVPSEVEAFDAAFLRRWPDYGQPMPSSS